MNPKPSARQHPTHKLFTELRRVAPYPLGVTAVPEQIQGTSFFPGGTGLWCGEAGKLPAFPNGGVMVLGHDFHSVAGYERSRENEAENLRTPTWRHLLPLLSRASIPLERCFFTNVYMGLREGQATTGPFPGSASPEFVERCQKFFLLQLAAQRPALILALGTHVPPFLAPLSLKLSRWASSKTFRERDSENGSVVDGVTFRVKAAHTCVVASLVHPSFRPSNVRHRRWRALTGDAAELALVLEAVKRAGMHLSHGKI